MRRSFWALPVGLNIGLFSVVLVSVGSLSGPISQGRQEPPVEVVSPITLEQSEAAAGRVIYRDGLGANELFVLANGRLLESGAVEQHAGLNNLYVVRTSFWAKLPDFLPHYGEVIHFESSRFAVMRLNPSMVAQLSGFLHVEGMACGVLEKIDHHAVYLEAVVTPVPVIPVDQKISEIENLVSQVSADNIKATIEKLSAITTRLHSSPTGKTIAAVLAQDYEVLRNGRKDVSISFFDHGSLTPQNSLIVRITGTEKPDEIVVLGSHIDSISFDGFGGSGRSPGSDDNASGTATNMEVFRIMMESGYRPSRTIEIHGYAAEEIGLVGSKDIAQKYRAASKEVVSMVQYDMNLYKAPGTEDKIWFVTNSTDVGLNDSLSKLVDQYTGVTWGKKNLSSGSSDHASWTRQGYAAAFPFEDPAAHNKHIHSQGDNTVNATAFTQAAAFAKLGLAYLGHFAGI